MKFRTNDSTKREHVAKMNRDIAMERMKHSVPETARNLIENHIRSGEMKNENTK